MDRVPMTPEGFQRMVEELRVLKEVTRPQVVRDIEEARAHGDISENAEYEDAKERQARCEGQMRDLESRVSRVEIIDIKKMRPSDRVVFGTTVVLEDQESDETLKFQIVGEFEADVKQGKISVQSPMATAVIGKSVGDEVTVNAPKGPKSYAITDVKYI
jgi:transcription elongation factor GreA